MLNSTAMSIGSGMNIILEKAKVYHEIPLDEKYMGEERGGSKETCLRTLRRKTGKEGWDGLEELVHVRLW